jgi:hypothetical protein
MAESHRLQKRILLLNILLGFFLWFLSLLIAGLREYPNSAWTIIGIFLPGLLFYFLKKSVLVAKIILFLNLCSLVYPAVEFYRAFGVDAGPEMKDLLMTYATVFTFAAFLFLWSSYLLLKQLIASQL